MANQLYVPAREKYLKGLFDWEADAVSVQLVDSDYIFNEDHEFLTAIPAISRVEAPKLIGTPSAVNGFANGDSVDYPFLVHPVPISQVVILLDTGVAATSELIAYYDTVVGFPILATGASYTLAPDIVFGGFFRL